MRITDQQQVELLLASVQEIRQNIFNRQEQIASGRRVNRPSDDPPAAERISQFKNALQVTEKRQFSVNEGIARLNVSDGSLETATNVIQRAKELALQGRNDTNSATERSNIAKEVNELLQTLVGLANTQLSGRSIFAGFETQTDPYALNTTTVTSSVNANNTGSGSISASVATPASLEPNLYAITYNGTTYDVTNVTTGDTEVSGGTSPLTFDGISATISGSPSTGDIFYARPLYSYQGDANDIAIEIGDGKIVATNVVGSQVFSGPTVDLFDVLQDLHQALTTNDGDGIETEIGNLDSALTQVTNARADVGASTNRLEIVKESLSLVALNTDTLRSTFEDADLAKVASELATLQVNLEASLAVLTRQYETNLLQFLR